MKGFLQEYGIIMVVVAVVLGMLAFGKTGYAKSIQNAILGSADHIVETGEGVTKGSDVKSSDFFNIEGKEYIVLEKQGNNQALVMTADSIGDKQFQSDFDWNTYLRPDGQNANTYEGSKIDNYLENEWYNSLSSTMKTAIQPTNIKQVSYTNYTDPDSKQETGYKGQVYNTISRHAFLPSVSEIGKVVDLKNKDKVKTFLDDAHDTHTWTRDSYKYRANSGEYLNDYYGCLLDSSVIGGYSIHPTFVIDLSKVDYTVAGHTDYK